MPHLLELVADGPVMRAVVELMLCVLFHIVSYLVGFYMSVTRIRVWQIKILTSTFKPNIYTYVCMQVEFPLHDFTAQVCKCAPLLKYAKKNGTGSLVNKFLSK